jgi:hypothetical protein
MDTQPGMLIRVHGTWDGWQSAEVRLEDLHDVHWLTPLRAPHAFLHATIACSAIVSGSIPHSCDPENGPHRLLVCVIKKHTVGSTYTELTRRADGRDRPPDILTRAASTARRRLAV